MVKREELVKLYQAYRFFIFPAVVALSSLFLIIFAILPQTVKLLDNQRVIASLSNKSKLLETKASVLESYDAKDLSAKTELATSVFPSDKDFANVVGLIQRLTTQSGFSIVSFTLGGGNQSGQTESYTVTVEVKGVKLLLQTLLDAIESSPRLIRVSNIEMASNQATQVVEATLTMNVLYASLPQTFGTEDTPLPQITQTDEALLTALSKTTSVSSGLEAAQPSIRGKTNPFE